MSDITSNTDRSIFHGIAFVTILTASCLLLNSCDGDLDLLRCSSEAAARCPAHSTCVVQDGAAVCVCDEGYIEAGDACIEDPCEGVDCSGHGTCVLEGEQAVCACDPGYEPDGLACVLAPCTDDADCDDGNSCSRDICQKGVCKYWYYAELTYCDDGLWCTVTDICREGVCVGSPRNCCMGPDDDRPNNCNEDTDTCEFSSGVTCDDGNACTKDTCNPAGGCSHTDDSGGCDDGNPCTDEFCNPDTGCEYSFNENTCDDGLFCNGTDTCDGAGECVHTGDPCDDLVCDEFRDSCYDEGWYELGGSASGTGDDAGLSAGRTTGMVFDSSGMPIVGFVYDMWGSHYGITKYDGTSWELPVDASGHGSSLAIDEYNRLLTTSENRGDHTSCLSVERFDSDQWTLLGDCSETSLGSDGRYPSIALDRLGNPVVTWFVGTEENWSEGSIFIRRYEDTNWLEVGIGSASGTGVIDEAVAGSPVLALDSDDNPLVAYSIDGEVRVKRFDATQGEGSWLQVGEGLPGACPRLVLDHEDRPVLAWQDNTSGQGRVFVKWFDGDSWAEMGQESATEDGISGDIGSAACPSMTLDSNGNPLAAWVQVDADLDEIEVRIKRFDPETPGGGWTEVESGTVSSGGMYDCSDIAVAAGAGRVCVAWSEWTGDGPDEGSRVFLRCADE